MTHGLKTHALIERSGGYVTRSHLQGHFLNAIQGVEGSLEQPRCQTVTPLISPDSRSIDFCSNLSDTDTRLRLTDDALGANTRPCKTVGQEVGQKRQARSVCVVV